MILDLSGVDLANCSGLTQWDYAAHNITNFVSFKNISTSIDFSTNSKLTHDSLLSIINNLSTVSTTQTLTIGSTNLAKLSSDEIVIATNKGWTVI